MSSNNSDKTLNFDNLESLSENLKIQNKCTLVGVAVSADEPQALVDFFSEIPVLPGVSFVVVTHLTSNFIKVVHVLKSLTLQIPLIEIKDEESIEPSRVYFSSGNRNLLISAHKIRAVDEHPINDLNSPIDIFFNTLGYGWKEMAVGIILSGLGSDGVKGGLSIKQNGGKLYVQDPLSIRLNSIPISGTSLKLADKVLGPRAIAKEIVDIERNKSKFLSKIDAEKEKAKLKLKNILKEVYKHTHVAFHFYKDAAILQRIEKRMNTWGVVSLGAYYEVIKSAPNEINSLFDELLTGSTCFFRDTNVFETLKNNLLSYWKETKELRIWCVGCATGEEAYSLGIILQELIEDKKLDGSFKIFATDIDKKAIEIAGEGIYDNRISTNVNPKRLKRFFHQTKGTYQVIESIREKIVFASHNVFTDPAFVNIDLIVARNLLGALKEEGQRKVLNNFMFSLKTEGLLLLGLGENLFDVKSSFFLFDASNNLYHKIVSPKLKIEEEEEEKDYRSKIESNEYILQSKMLKPSVNKQEEFVNIMVNKHVPPTVFVNDAFDILYSHGPLESIFSFPKEEVNFNLLQMLSYENALIFRSGVRKAKNDKKKVLRNILIDKGTTFLKLDISFESLWIRHLNQKVVLIEFRQTLVDENMDDLAELISNGSISERIKTLELELNESKLEMRSILDQLETSNEELLSSNEELQVANDDLHNNNEEIQTINEELNEVNDKLRQKVQEVSELNNDLDNILKSTDIGIVFLDDKLKIRWFTPNIKLAFNLQPDDLGKPLTYLARKINNPDIAELGKNVLNNLPSKETEINDCFGRDYLLRFLPYQKKNQQTATGIILTFVEISILKKVERELGKSEGLHRRLIAESTSLTLTTDAEGNFVKVNDDWQKFTGQTYEEYKDFGWSRSIFKEDRPVFLEAWKEAVRNKSFFRSSARLFNIANKKYHHFEVNAVPFLDDNGNIREWFGAIIDINTTVEAQQNLRKQNDHLQLAFDITKMGTYHHNLVSKEAIWDDRMYEIFGFKPGEVDPKEGFYQRIHPEDSVFVRESIASLFKQEKGNEFEFNYRIIHDNKEVRHIATKGLINRSAKGSIELLTGVVLDETVRKEANIKLVEKTKELETSNRELEQFAYVTTHDLRAPIINLKQLLKIFKRRNFVTKENEKLFVQMDNSIYELHETLHDLIAIVALKKPLNETVENINFKEMLEKILIGIMEMVKEAEADFFVDFDKAPGIQYVPGHVKSIMLNLLSNALKYRSEERKLLIEIKTEQCADNFICFSVKDNGVGIDPNHRDKLFGLFQRFREDREGKGVGLFITKSQVESLGGRMEVDSELGVGSNFKVYLKNAPLIKVN